MKSVLPKVLHPAAGRPLLDHVLRAVAGLKPERTAVVLGFAREQVSEALKKLGWTDVDIVVQPAPRGSGHAVLMARPWLKRRRGTLLVVYGDTPLITTDTLRRLVTAHQKSAHAATFLAMDIADPSGYGRMILETPGLLSRIVEHKDATPEERSVRLVNSGVACWQMAPLLKTLPKLKPNNAKREYYLTDAVSLLRFSGETVGVVTASDPGEMQGVNSRVELADAEASLRKRVLIHWMREGVTIVDPASTYIDDRATLAADVTLWPGTLILGAARIASGAEIGPYSVVEGATVGPAAKVGPFARLRPGAVIGPEARIGNFVEVKKSRVGRGSKVNHLTYIGDAEIGDGVNIGAGTITCNYDGYHKHATRIGDGVFIGSNTNLVAPVDVGEGAIVAAGSTITENVPAQALGIARARQQVKEKWAYEFRKTQNKKRV